MKNKKVIAIIAVGLLALLATGGVASLPSMGADSVSVEVELASLSMEDEARGDVVTRVAPAIDQARKGCPGASESSALSDTSFSEIDAILADKLVFLFFYADWCHYCHEQVPIIDELEQEYGGRAAFIRVNTDEEPRWKEGFEVTSYPTMIVIWGKSDEQYEFERLKGLTAKEGLEAAIERGISQFEEGALSQSYAANSSDNVRFKGEVTDVSFGLGCTDVTVQITEIISDPVGDMDVGETAIARSCYGSEAQMDQVAVGDTVEVYGRYTAIDVNMSHRISLETSEHYLKKIVVDVWFKGEVISVTSLPGGVKVEVKIDEILMDPQGNLKIEDVAVVSGGIYPGGPQIDNVADGDKVEVYGKYKGLEEGKHQVSLEKSYHFLKKKTAGPGEVIECMEISSPGTYTLVEDIHESAAERCIVITASNVTFDGNDHYISAAEIIDGTQHRYAFHVADTDGLSNVVIKNVSIPGDWDTGILFSGVDYGKIENSYIANNNDYGIQLDNCSHCDVTGNDVNHNQDGICLMDSNDNNITGNTCEGNYSGICLFRSSNNNITGNTTQVNTLGIDLYQNSNNNTISDNTIQTNGNQGLYIDTGCTGNKVNSNFVCSNDQREQGYADIHTGVLGANSGDDNTCDNTYNWQDTSATGGCQHPCADKDGDDVSDNTDNCPDVPNPNQDDADLDQVGDACDNCPSKKNSDQEDSDKDGKGDVCDNCPNKANSDQEDSDKDGKGDVCDNCLNTANSDQSNSDGDKYGDACDNCPNKKNNDQKNSDTDKYGDACDNCPNDDNPKQEDWDSDGLGDICDTCPKCGDRVITKGCPFSGYHGYAFENKHDKCFGMSWTAAIYYHGELTIPPNRTDKYLWDATQNMRDYVGLTHLNEGGLSGDEKTIWDRIKDYQDSGRNCLSTNSIRGQPLPGESNYAHVIQAELQKIKDSLDQGKACLVGLKGKESGGKGASGKVFHAVVAYDYEYYPLTNVAGQTFEEEWDIAIYDPNYWYDPRPIAHPWCGDEFLHIKLYGYCPTKPEYSTASFTYGDYTNLKYVSAAKNQTKTEQAAGLVNPGGIIASLSPFDGSAEFHAYDSLGRHTGPDGTGGVEKGIPESEYEIDEATGEQSIVIHTEGEEDFTFEVRGASEGTFNMAITKVGNPSERSDVYRNVPLTAASVAELGVGPGGDQLLKVDEDGDGTFETQKAPDDTSVDSDSDRLPDDWETQYETQVNVPDAGDDPDNDDLTNYEEYIGGTHPRNPDTDGDGVLDSLDVCPGHNDNADSDGDGIPDGCDVAPVISDVGASVQGKSATILWDTDRQADSLVRYGTQPGVYNWQEYKASLVEYHAVTLVDLEVGTKYYYVVSSTDEGGNPSQSQEYDFTTLTWDPLIYDENKNGEIDKMEAIHAVMDYFDGVRTKMEAIEVVMLYFT